MANQHIGNLPSINTDDTETATIQERKKEPEVGTGAQTGVAAAAAEAVATAAAAVASPAQTMNYVRGGGSGDRCEARVQECQTNGNQSPFAPTGSGYYRDSVRP